MNGSISHLCHTAISFDATRHHVIMELIWYHRGRNNMIRKSFAVMVTSSPMPKFIPCTRTHQRSICCYLCKTVAHGLKPRCPRHILVFFEKNIFTMVVTSPFAPTAHFITRHFGAHLEHCRHNVTNIPYVNISVHATPRHATQRFPRHTSSQTFREISKTATEVTSHILTQ